MDKKDFEQGTDIISVLEFKFQKGKDFGFFPCCIPRALNRASHVEEFQKIFEIFPYLQNGKKYLQTTHLIRG